MNLGYQIGIWRCSPGRSLRRHGPSPNGTVNIAHEDVWNAKLTPLLFQARHNHQSGSLENSHYFLK